MNITLDIIKLELPSEILRERLESFSSYFSNDEDIVNGILNDSFDEEIPSYADSCVSVYTYDRLLWLANNFQHCDQYEALDCGAKTPEEVAAFCWAQAIEEETRALILECRKAIKHLL